MITPVPMKQSRWKCDNKSHEESGIVQYDLKPDNITENLQKRAHILWNTYDSSGFHELITNMLTILSISSIARLDD